MFFKNSWLFILGIIYLLLPIDLIPDITPIFGTFDDSTLIILGLIKQYIDFKKRKKSGV